MDENQNIREETKFPDLAGKSFGMVKKALGQLWAQTPWGEPEDTAYYCGADEAEEGKGEIRKRKWMSIGCAVYGVVFGFFCTMLFQHFSHLYGGSVSVVGPVINTILLIVLAMIYVAITALIYFILKWTVVRSMDEDGLEAMQVSITYGVLCLLLFSILAFILPFNLFELF